MISVVYVDDEPELLEIGKLFLEQDPEFSVDTTISAIDALEKIRKKNYDAILSDYQMPEMDGIQFLQAVRGTGNRIPFIIFTGRGREEVIIKALNSGVDYYLQKGGDPKAQFAELTHIVGKAVRQRRADDALKESEAKYRSILENIQDVYYRTDADGHLILASPSIAAVLGYDSPYDLYGKEIARTMYLNPEDRTQFLADLERTGSLVNYELVLKKRDGTPIDVSTSSHKYYDPDGNYLGVEGIFRDVTERKKTEDNLRLAYDQITAAEEKLRTRLDELKAGQDALRTSERKLHQIVNGSPIPQFVLDEKHTVIAWNSALERYSGVRAADVIGTTDPWKAFYSDKRPVLADLLVNGLIEKIPEWYAGKFSPSKYIDGAYEATDFFPRMGTSGIWLYFTASIIRDSEGRIIGAVETLEDITDRKNAEAELLSLSRFQQSIISNANVWMMVLDQWGTVLLWNNAAAEISGYSEDEVLHKNSIWKSLYPEKEYRKKITRTILQVIYEREYLQNFETTIHTKTGEQKTILWNTRSLAETPSDTVTFVAIGVDITKSIEAEKAHKSSESRLAAIVGGSPIPQFVIDKDHRVIYWNPALEQYSGIKAAEIIGTRQQWKAFYDVERPCMADLLVDNLIGKIPQWYAGKFKKSRLIEDAYEATDFFPNMGPSGTWLYFTASPLRDENGTVIGAVETLEDVTEEKKGEETLRLINKKLNLMSSITRHDILNQLTALSGYLDLLKARVTDERTREYISTCDNAAHNIEHQIMFTRQYQDIGVEKPKWQNAHDIIQQAASETDGIQVLIEPGLNSVELNADPLLVRVFFNLIENAARHGGQITHVLFFGIEGPDGYILVCEDDGAGVKDKDKERIFERGFGKHTGFGLFLSREILSITGLTIRECGKAGSGARFEIGIPKGMFRRTGG